MRRMFTAMLYFSVLTLLVVTGCNNEHDKKKADSDKGGDVLVLEFDEIEVIPEGDAKAVKVKKGKAEKAEAPKGSGVTAKVDGDKLTISAGKDATVGTHQVKVTGGKKDATLKVTVKKKDS